MKMFEASVVSVPAMANADITGWIERALGDKVLDRAAPYSRPYVVPFRKDPAAPREKKWDAPSAVRRLRRRAGGQNKEKIDWGKYSEGFSYIAVDGTKFSDYKFPVRDVVSGKLVSVFRAVTAAAGRLQNSSLPDEDKKLVAKRLLREYKEIHEVSDEEIPDSLNQLAE
jgi:hypothetical protein